MKRWFVAHTHANAEGLAVLNLERQGFGTYLPAYAKRRSHARKVETVRAPLFPGYVFVEMDTEAQRWRAVLSTAGVRRLVSLGAEPAPLPGSVLDEIRRREGRDGLVSLEPRPGFPPGSQVTIDVGRDTELSALFEEVDDRRRAVVLVDLLGRRMRLALPLDRVSA